MAEIQDISKITVGGVTYNIKDSKVTSADNHYTPTANSSSVLNAGTGEIVAIQRDAKGHVTGIGISKEITKLQLFDATGNNASSVGDWLNVLINNNGAMYNAILKGYTHFELTYNANTQDAFPYLTMYSGDDFTQFVSQWLQYILQANAYKTAEYKLHFSFIEPNKDDVKTISFNKITSYGANGEVILGSLNLSTYIALGLANMGFSIEIVANLIEGEVFVHHNVTPFAK